MTTAARQRAFMLSKEESERRVVLVAEHHHSIAAINELVRAYNANHSDENLATINTAIDAHNAGVLGKIQSFAAEIGEHWREEFDEKSERWQEGEKGSDANAWVEEWEELAEFDEVGWLDPEEGADLEELTEVEAGAGDTLDAMSESAD